MSAGDARYEVNVTPVGFDGINPVYEVSLYLFIESGICGPFSETVRVVGRPAIAATVEAWGYRIDSAFGPVCRNGFATAKVIPLERMVDA